MLIQLNAEVWISILYWLLKYRKQMAEKFCEFGDNEFTEITQTWLHQWTRNVTLGPLEMTRDTQGQLALLNRNEIPSNIIAFSTIKFSYLDDGVLHFLGKVQRLFSKVSLKIGYKNVQMQTVLRHLLPLTNGIEAIAIYWAEPQLSAFFRDEFPTLFYEAGILEVDCPDPGEFQKEDNPISRWLFTPRNNGQPKTLIMYECDEEELHEIVKHIRQHFLNRLLGTLCFFVGIWSTYLDTVEATTIQNEKGEQLVVQKYAVEDENNCDVLLIARCLSDVGGEWLTQKFQGLADYRFNEHKRRIEICYPDICEIDEAAAGGSAVE